MELDELLDKLYTEPDLDKRRYIPDKLAKIGNWKSTIPLGELVTDPDQPEIMRNEAIESLGKQGDPRAIKYLVQVLDHSVDDIRRTAVWSLGQIGTPKTLDPVFSMTDDPNVDVRRWVAKSAGRIRTDRVIPKLKAYNEKISLQDERVLADIVRAVSSQFDRLSSEDYDYWLDVSYDIVTSDIRNYVKQASMLLLNQLYSTGIAPETDKLKEVFHSLPENDPLVRPHIIESMGYAKEIDFLLDQDHHAAIRALGIAGEIDLLQHYLDQDPTDKELIAILEAFIYTNSVPDLSPYYEHPNLTVKTQALELHARNGYPIEQIHSAYEQGEGTYKILEIFRYYGEQALPVLSENALHADKVARQTSVYSLISDQMLGVKKIHTELEQVLSKVSKKDRIWHIRRDARIGLERISSN